MDLALNNLQKLICHKTQTTTNEPTPLQGQDVTQGQFLSKLW